MLHRDLAQREERPARQSARQAIQNRLLISGFWHVAFLLLIIGLFALCVSHPEATWEFFRRGKRGRIQADGVAYFKMILFGGVGAGIATYLVWWLKQIPGVKSEIEELLETTQPVPMSLRVVTRGSGKHKRTLAELSGEGRDLSYRVGGLLTPSWFSDSLMRQDVLVYGADDPETPVVVEMLDGRLVMIDPG